MDSQDIMLCSYAFLLCAVVLEELRESESEDELPVSPTQQQNKKSTNCTNRKVSRPSTSTQRSAQKKRRLDKDEQRPQKVSKYEDAILLKEEGLENFFTEETDGVVGIKLESGEELVQHIKTETISVKHEQEDTSSDSEAGAI